MSAASAKTMKTAIPIGSRPTISQFPMKGRLAIVADGMGGYEGGQEASRIAVEAIEEVYANGGADGNPRTWLLEGFQAAHHRIQEYADKYPDLHGMGTTCTAMALLDHQLYFAHVGDSRLYLVRGSTISRLTHDHSYVSRLVENGVLRAEEAESHPQRHILTAALGAGNSVTPDCPGRTGLSRVRRCAGALHRWSVGPAHRKRDSSRGCRQDCG